MMLRRERRRSWLAVVAVVAAAGVAGCGGSDDDEGSAASGTTTTAKAEAGRSGAAVAFSAEEASKTALAYTGGTAGKADPSKAPIVIGWFNQDEGQGGVPWYTEAARAGVKYLNDELGGIDGHAVKLDECIVGNDPEQGQACAQRFLNDDKIKLVYAAESIGGYAPFMAAFRNADKLMIGTAPASPDDAKVKNALFLSPALLAIGAQVTYQRDYSKAKVVGVPFPDTPELRPYSGIYPQIYKAANIKVKTAFIKPDSPDYIGPLVSGGMRDVDAINLGMGSAGPSACVSYYKAAKQLGIDKTPTLGYNCLHPSIKKALGDFPPGWTYFQDYPSVNLADPSGQVGTFLYAMEKYGASDIKDQFGVPPTWGGVLTIGRWLNEVGTDNITLAAVKEVAEKHEGPLFMGQPKTSFGKGDFPSVSGLGNRFYTYVGNGEWKDATNGKWVEPVPGAFL